jgi:hypothetical protein
MTARACGCHAGLEALALALDGVGAPSGLACKAGEAPRHLTGAFVLQVPGALFVRGLGGLSGGCRFAYSRGSGPDAPRLRPRRAARGMWTSVAARRSTSTTPGRQRSCPLTWQPSGRIRPRLRRGPCGAQCNGLWSPVQQLDTRTGPLELSEGGEVAGIAAVCLSEGWTEGCGQQWNGTEGCGGDAGDCGGLGGWQDGGVVGMRIGTTGIAAGGVSSPSGDTARKCRCRKPGI